MTHADGFEYTPLMALLSEFHTTLVSEATFSKLTTFPGEHTYTGQTCAPPADYEPQNTSTSFINIQQT